MFPDENSVTFAIIILQPNTEGFCKRSYANHIVGPYISAGCSLQSPKLNYVPCARKCFVYCSDVRCWQSATPYHFSHVIFDVLGDMPWHSNGLSELALLLVLFDSLWMLSFYCWTVPVSRSTVLFFYTSSQTDMSQHQLHLSLCLVITFNSKTNT